MELTLVVKTTAKLAEAAEFNLVSNGGEEFVKLGTPTLWWTKERKKSLIHQRSKSGNNLRKRPHCCQTTLPPSPGPP